MESVAIIGFDHLPAALHQHILSFLPLTERVRCALATRSCAALLADPAFWAELRFDGAAEGSVDEDTLLQLCRRAGGRLRALDVSGPACKAVTICGLLIALDGLGLGLKSLRTWAPPADPNSDSPPAYASRRLLFNQAAATALADACPALASAAVEVCGTCMDAAAALRILPGPGEKHIIVRSDESSDATPLATAAEQAAETELAAALAAPERGVRRLDFMGGRDDGLAETPMLASLCRALTAESPLTEIHLVDCGVTDEGAVEIAAALAPGRSRLRTLDLGTFNNDDAGGGEEALLSALGANTTLAHLIFFAAWLGGPEAAATLAASLRSNSTLRTLSLIQCDLGTEDIASPVLSALASSTAAPSSCGLTALNISERRLTVEDCTALGLALAQPACRLETLGLQNCSFGDDGGTAIARGLESVGAASRLRSLDLSNNALGDAAAAALGSALAAQGPDGALRELDLGTNDFGPAAAGYLAEGLRVNSSLETLHLQFNSQMGLGGVAAIVRGIAGTSSTASGVRALSLKQCELGDAGVAAMLEAGLGRNSTLTELNVEGNRLGETGCLALAQWAAAHFGVAPEDADHLPEGSGAQQGTALPLSVSRTAEAGAGLPPRPLLLRLSDDYFEDAAKVKRLLTAPIERIVERANAAAAAAGWRYGGRRSALEITI